MQPISAKAPSLVGGAIIEEEEVSYEIQIKLQALQTSVAKLLYHGNPVKCPINFQFPVLSKKELLSKLKEEEPPFEILIEKTSSSPLRFKVFLYCPELQQQADEYATFLDDHIFYKTTPSVLEYTVNLCLEKDREERLQFYQQYLPESSPNGCRPINCAMILNQSGHSFYKSRLLANAALADVDLSGANLVEADCSEADLRNANLSNTCLVGTNLFKTRLKGVQFGENPNLTHSFSPTFDAKDPLPVLSSANWLITADQHVYFWDAATREKKGLIERRATKPPLIFIAMTQNQKYLFGITANGILSIWNNIPTRQSPTEEIDLHLSFIKGMKLSQFDNYLLLWGLNENGEDQMKVFPIKEENNELRIEDSIEIGSIHNLSDAVFMDKGGNFLCVQDHELINTDIQTRKVNTLYLIPEDFIAIAVSSTTKMVAYRTATQLVVIEPNGKSLINIPLQGDQGDKILFSTDEQSIYYTVNTTVICQFSLVEYKEILRMQPTKETIKEIFISSDSLSIIVVNQNREIIVLPLNQVTNLGKEFTGILPHVSFTSTSQELCLWTSATSLYTYEITKGLVNARHDMEKQKLFQQIEEILRNEAFSIDIHAFFTLFEKLHPILSPSFFRHFFKIFSSSLFERKTPFSVSALCMTPDHSHFVLLDNHELYVFSTVDQTIRKGEIQNFLDGSIKGLECSTDSMGDLYISLLMELNFQQVVILLKWAKEISQPEFIGKLASRNCKEIRFSNTCNFLYQLSENNTQVNTWTIESQPSCQLFNDFKVPLRCLDVNFAHQLIAVAGIDNKIFIWNVNSKRSVATFEVYHFVNRIEFSPDGKILSIQGEDYVSLWNLFDENENIDLFLIWRYPARLECRNAVIHKENFADDDFKDDLEISSRLLLRQRGVRVLI